MIWLVLLAAGFAAEPPTKADADAPRPRCTAKLRATFWPLEANTDPRLANRLAREGQLEICSRVNWRFRWQPVSINIKRVNELEKGQAKEKDTAARAAVAASPEP